MSKKSLFYSLFTTTIVCFLFNGAPCHSMDRLEEEGTSVAGHVSKEGANLTDSEKYEYYSGKLKEYSKNLNEASAYQNLLEQKIRLTLEEGIKDEDYRMLVYRDIISGEFRPGIGFDANWTNARGRARNH